MLPFLIGCIKVMPLLFWSELPSGSSQVTSGMAARYWTTWTVQVREYGCLAIAKVEGVNRMIGRGRAVEDVMQKRDNISHIPYTWVNKRMRLFPKLQGNMRLLPNMRLIMKAKIDHTPKP